MDSEDDVPKVAELGGAHLKQCSGLLGPMSECQWTWVHCWWAGEEGTLGSDCSLKSGFLNLWSLTCYYCCFWLSTRVHVTQSQVLFCSPSWSSNQQSLGLSSWLLHRHTLYLRETPCLLITLTSFLILYFYFSGIWKESQNTSLISLQPLDFWRAPQ